MKRGVFSHIAGAYKQASGNCLAYIAYLPWLLKPFFLPIALFYALFLLLVSMVFYVLIILDNLG